jgi:hypothetical protein
VAATLSHDAWVESATALRLGVATTDLGGRIELQHPRWSAAGAVRHRGVSDDNASWMAEGTLRLQLAAGRSEWHAFTWLSQESYRRVSQVYFAPAAFTRADVGVEWRRWLVRPRFRDDRDRSLTAGYAIGIDSRQYVYHHPSGRFAVDLRSGLALEARGSWLWSPTYRSTDATLSLRIGGAGPVRGAASR